MTKHSTSISVVEESDVPPMVVCATCRRVECPGCALPIARPSAEPTIDWEQPTHGFARALWQTALRSSLEPARVFGTLPAGRVGTALSFALLAESVAIGSFGVLAVTLAFSVAPEFSLRVVTRPLGLAYLFGGLGAASLTMVLLHALWGVCLEFGAQRRERGGLRHSLRFALYACGWDLLTSPAGLVLGLWQRGLRRTFAAMGSAVRAPRKALLAYQEELRHFESGARRRGMQLSVLVLGAFLLLLLPALGFAFVSFAEWAVDA